MGIQVELWLRTNYWFLGAHLSSKRVETEGLNCHSESSSLYLLFGSTLWLLEVVLRPVFPLTLLIAPDLCPLFAIMWRIRTSASKYSPKSNDNSDVNFEQQYLFICLWIGWSLKWQHIHGDIKSHLFLSFLGERLKKKCLKEQIVLKGFSPGCLQTSKSLLLQEDIQCSSL